MVTRKSLAAAAIAVVTMTSASAETGIEKRSNGEVLVESGRLSLTIDTANGLQPRDLRDKKAKLNYADAEYSWPWSSAPTVKATQIVRRSPGKSSVQFKARQGRLEVQITYAVSDREPDTISETVRIRNTGPEKLDLGDFACGFAKRTDRIGDAKFCNVPYRVHPETGELCEYTAKDLATRQSWYSTARSAIYNRRESDTWGAEGWAWTTGDRTLLVTKYNPDAMEWSLLTPLAPKVGPSTLRFGGAGRWKLGDPEGSASLEPGKSFTFGVTRYQAMDGGWKQAYAAFHRFTESKGHRLPRGYNPPVHWNELYNNPLWWAGDTLENREKMYRKEDMLAEVEIAKEFGCECFYLDPGWDTTFGSNIWADKRLGDQKAFVKLLKERYGMVMALHTPLAPWTDPAEYPVEARMMNKQGERIGELCTASKAYIDTKVARLIKLCDDGAYFLMYDGSWFPGECWDPSHGHSLPMTHQEHLDAILRIQQLLHKAHPKAVIEQHDPMTGPGTPRYVPTYFMHGKPGAFDELWGYEYMVEPLDDIVSRRAMSLYYANLAYSIPIYLHIDLRKDNANALMFWWYASTCRHLGVGGKSADPAVWNAQKAAMRDYLAYKKFFTQGRFYGISETVHAHTLGTRSVLNCFNLQDSETTCNVLLRPEEIGLSRGKLKAQGATLQMNEGSAVLQVVIPPMGHRMIVLN